MQLQPAGANDKRKQFIATWLRILAETTLQKTGDELTVEKIKSYEIALAKVSDRALVVGLRRCVEECKFFPTAEEIRERCVLPKEEQEAIYESFTQRVIEAAKSRKHLPSILDEDVQRRIAEAMPRSRQIALGIQNPRPVDVAARVNELKRQASMLGASDWRRDTAGSSGGLV